MEMNNIKEEMRKIVEAMEEVNEAPIPEDWQLQETYKVAEQAMHMFMSRVKRLNKMVDEFEGDEDTKTHWNYAVYSLSDHLEEFFKDLKIR